LVFSVLTFHRFGVFYPHTSQNKGAQDMKLTETIYTTENIPDISMLDWKPHSAGLGGEQAVIKFQNGYSASCIRGGRFYTTNGTYEIAILHGGQIDYTTPLTGDVLGYLSDDEANKVLADIAALPVKAEAA
jgi:hypothetical protein